MLGQPSSLVRVAAVARAQIGERRRDRRARLIAQRPTSASVMPSVGIGARIFAHACALPNHLRVLRTHLRACRRARSAGSERPPRARGERAVLEAAAARRPPSACPRGTSSPRCRPRARARTRASSRGRSRLRRGGAGCRRRGASPSRVSGCLKSSSFATQRMSHGKNESRNGSACDSWLATTTYARWSMSAGRSPSMSNFHSGERRRRGATEPAHPRPGMRCVGSPRWRNDDTAMIGRNADHRAEFGVGPQADDRVGLLHGS